MTQKLETTRTSITRLKQGMRRFKLLREHNLKRQEPRLRD